MFAVCVSFKIRPEDVAQFRDLMLRQAQNSLSLEDGCLRFDVCDNAQSPDAVFLYEIYSDAAAFDLHLESAHFKVFDRAVADMVLEKKVQTFDRVVS